VDNFWELIRDDFMPKLFPEKDVDTYPDLFDVGFLYDLDETTMPWAPRYLGDTKSIVLLGAVRMRQLRILPNRGCLLPPNLTQFVDNRCYGNFDAEHQSQVYYPKRFTPAYLLPFYMWNPQNRTEMMPVAGRFGTYPGDGFMLEMPLDRAEMLRTVKHLWEWDWIDRQTRAVVVEVNTFNPNLNVISVNTLLFEFSPSGMVEVRHKIFALPTTFLSLVALAEEGPVAFLLQVLLTVFILLFLIYHGFLIAKDPRTYFVYPWNLLDLVQIILFMTYMSYRAGLVSLYEGANALQPELAGMPAVYMPYSQLEAPFKRAQAVMAWLVLFAWIRVFKYLTLVKAFRVLIRTIEQCTWELCVFSGLYLTMTIGFTVAFVIGFSDASTTAELYSTFWGVFFALFFMLVGGVELSPILGQGTTLGYALFLAYIVLGVLLLFNFFMAIVLDTYTVVSIRLMQTGGEEDKNPVVVFMYTYWQKMWGRFLVVEDEENIGHPDEQYIECYLLPDVLVDKWRAKQHALLDLLREAKSKEDDEDGAGMLGALRRGSKIAGRSISKQSIMVGSKGSKDGQPEFKGRASKFMSVLSKGSKKTSKAMPRLNEKVISRLQLQRLLDEDAQARTVLDSTRAIDVIRRFRAERGPDPFQEINHLQERVVLRLDELEKAGLQLEFSEVETLKMVSQGLNDALTEVQNQWRMELTTLLESAATLSNTLICLTNKLQDASQHQTEIQKDFQVE
jgi:hypothetical protein